ncbi:EF-G C-terminal domain-like protein, partial [Gymnopus androsaceus JB14]
MLAMFSCDIQCSTDVLGKVYAVVSKPKGQIVAKEMKEGTSFFTITARLPVVESFGFADDIWKWTSGAASPMLVFSGYDLLPLSPVLGPHNQRGARRPWHNSGK